MRGGFAVDRTKFYAYLRRKNAGVFGTSLSQSQVEGIEAILEEARRRSTPLKHLAYILATPYHETGGKMQPVRENLNYSVHGLLKTFGRHRISEADAKRFGRSGSRKADQVAIANTVYGGDWGLKNLGNTQIGDGWKYRGGGLPQTTGRRNYAKFGMANNPEKSGELLPSVTMMFDGMEQGLYTGLKLSDFDTYKPMRQIINGMDRAGDVAGYAEAFEAALRAGGYSTITFAPYRPDKPVQPPKPKPAPDTRKPEKPASDSKTVPSGLDKPLAKSKTIWSMLLANGAGILTAFSTLDWKVALPIVVVIAIAGFVVFKERHRYAKEARKIMAELSE
jgi:putative chitinase